MSMNADQENFESLRRLLALKKHEQPPPGYFNDFSHQVIMHIRNNGPGEQGLGLEAMLWQTPCLHRFWRALEHNPLLAGGFGVLVCALLLSGVVFSERASTPDLSIADPKSEIALKDLSTLDNPLLAKPPQSEFSSSTKGVSTLESRASLFPSHGDIKPIMFNISPDN